jgi:hypothetical protein
MSRVVEVCSCPITLRTTFIGTPSVTSHVAYECRRSWNRRPPVACFATWATASRSVGCTLVLSRPVAARQVAFHPPSSSTTWPSSPARTSDGSHTRRRKLFRLSGPPDRLGKTSAPGSRSAPNRVPSGPSTPPPGTQAAAPSGTPARDFGNGLSTTSEGVSTATWTTRSSRRSRSTASHARPAHSPHRRPAPAAAQRIARCRSGVAGRSRPAKSVRLIDGGADRTTRFAGPVRPPPGSRPAASRAPPS